MLRDILHSKYFGIWTLKSEREYVEALKRTILYEGDMNPNRRCINLLNGMFDLQDFKLKEHSPEYFSTMQIPINYDESAECHQFIKFINRALNNDMERIKLIQEWTGYLLTTETKAQKALFLYGSGANGKGVYIDTISKIIGQDNISNIPLNELHKGFSRICLLDKTANISNENEFNGRSMNTQYFKAIVGEDRIQA